MTSTSSTTVSIDNFPENSTPTVELKDQSESIIDDPCNNYEWSLVFFIILILSLMLICLEFYALFKRRSDLFSGFDIAIIFSFACTVIQFGPELTQLLHAGHDVAFYTQSGCKLLHYTKFGIKSVILAVIISLMLYAWLITRHNFNQEQVDKRIRHFLPWLIMLCFGIEAVLGMPAAIYTDYLPHIHKVSVIKICLFINETSYRSVRQSQNLSYQVTDLLCSISYLILSIFMKYLDKSL